MTLKPGEEIGMEVHPTIDQFFRFEVGQGKVTIAGVDFAVKDGDVAIVPAGSMHNVVNTGTGDLKLYTIYSPPNHPPGTVHKTKAEAAVAEQAEHA
jgi:mannose-6-phosphate isomerase-like protein (cupin superfamily)